MNPLQLRREIEDEMKRTRIDKTRICELLLKIVDTGIGEGSQGPVGPQGERGPVGPAGPAGICKCKCATVSITEEPKKVVTATKKVKKSTTTD